MFDLVHKHKRIVQIILALLIVPFAIWGIESYRMGGPGGDAVAEVNGIKISQRELENEMRRQQDQLRRMLGRAYDPAVFDTPEARRTVLDSLVSQKLIAHAATKGNLTVTDDMLAEVIHSVPAFQVNGQFSKAAYETMLRQQDPPLSSAQFEQRLRLDLALQQLGRAVAESAIAPRAVAERLVSLETQKREIQEVRLPAQQYLPQVKVDDARVKEYYEANADEFRTPERVRAEYVLLSSDALAREEQVSAEDVKAYWEQQYGKKFAERDAARKKIESILAEVKKDPSRFAEVAKRESADRASAEQGGDLGFQGRGSFVKPFEDALFRLRQGEVSGVVESEFGFHVIRLEGVRKGADGREERRASHILVATPSDARPFAEMRPQIEAELRKTRAARRFAESAEAFGNLVYEQPDSLKPAAERFKLQIRTTPWINKSASQELGPLDNPKLLGALFSADAIKNRRNTDAIEVAPGTLVAARVVEHQPAAQRGLDEVKGEIVEKLKRRQAAELAQKDGEAKLAELRKGNDSLKWSAPKTVSRREGQGIPPEILGPVTAADVAKLPAYVGLPIPESGYLLVRIAKVSEGAKPDAQDAARVSQLYGAAQYEGYLASLRERADIEIRKGALEKK